MVLGYDKKLYILAFDHRGSFQKKMFGIEGDPTPEETETIVDAKRLIFEGILEAVGRDAEPGATGVLVDEQFGSDIPRHAREHGLTLAMPVEKSGQTEFDFDYGEDFGAHIEEFDPDFSKVLSATTPGTTRGSRSDSSDASSDWRTGSTDATASSCSSCSCRPPTSSSRSSAATPTVMTRSCDRS